MRTGIRFWALVLAAASLSTSATAAAQAGPTSDGTSVTESRAPINGGAFGLPGQGAMFVLRPISNGRMIIEDQHGHRYLMPRGNGVYTDGVTGGGGKSVRIIDSTTIEYTTGLGTPALLLRTGEGDSWEDYTIRVNNALSTYYQAKTAELKAQQAQQQFEEEAPVETPMPAQPMGGAFLDEMRSMTRQSQIETDRAREQTRQILAGNNSRSSATSVATAPASPQAIAAAAPANAVETAQPQKVHPQQCASKKHAEFGVGGTSPDQGIAMQLLEKNAKSQCWTPDQSQLGYRLGPASCEWDKYNSRFNCRAVVTCQREVCPEASGVSSQ